MYQPSAQTFGVVYIENHSLGVCIFDEKKLEINCGQILFYSYFDKYFLSEKLLKCSQVITNQPLNSIFDQIRGKVDEFKGQIKDESIIHLLKQMPFQNPNGIINKDNFFNMMLEDSVYKFKALGMLIYHLMNNTVIFKREGIYFESIEFWNDYIFNHVQFTQTEIDFMEITTQFIHPSFVKNNVYNTLGSSTMKIYDSFLKTKGGKKYLKRIMLNPTYDKKQLEKRHAVIQWMNKIMGDKKYFCKLFKNIYAVDSIIYRFQRDRIEDDDWRKLIKSMQNMIELRNSLPLQNLPEIIRKILDKQYWPKLIKTLSHLNKVIQISPFGIKDNYDPRLREFKQIYLQMPRILAQISRKQKWDPSFKLVFMPQLGYLVQIPHQVQIEQQDSQWSLKFINCNGKFYSNSVTLKLDQEYGDINSSIQDLQKSIFDQLDQDINLIADQLIDLFWGVSVIQFYWGVSQLGKLMAVPRMTEQQLILINGWSMSLGAYAVQNHAFSFHHQKGPKQRVFNSQLNIVNTNYSNRCSILSGPNGAGKTIYMKQLGTILYLAHCGFNVPATYAQIPLCDRILVAKNSSSLHVHQSGFDNQLISLSKIMNKNVITNKCMILIDQIGLSLDYAISMKTLYACVRYLSNNKLSRFQKNKYLSKSTDHFTIPITLIITHLTQLMTNQLIQENYYVRYLTMDVNNNFQFLFKIKPGLVKSGYGIKAAQEFISDEKFIEKAYEFWNKLK